MNDNAIEPLLIAACELPQGDDAVWQNRLLIWKKPEIWVPLLTAWLSAVLRADAMKRLKPGVERDICWDDTQWLDVLGKCVKGSIETLTEDLAAALLPSKIRTYHGCRTEDAGEYFRNGLLTHNRERLKARALAIIQAHEELYAMKSRLDRVIADIDNTPTEEGRAYVVVSDEALLDSAHYLIHGSELIMSVFDEAGRAVLKHIGAPTLIEIDLPFSILNNSDRRGFAKDMLQEWTRLACNGQEWVAPINCSFLLTQDMSPEYVVSHTHPAALTDPHDGMQIYRSPITTCKHCDNANR